jgi:hypothetical protein
VSIFFDEDLTPMMSINKTFQKNRHLMFCLLVAGIEITITICPD